MRNGLRGCVVGLLLWVLLVWDLRGGSSWKLEMLPMQQKGPTCVGFAWYHVLNTTPYKVRGRQLPTPYEIHREASIRLYGRHRMTGVYSIDAGQWLQERGFIKSLRATTSLTLVLNHLQNVGPVPISSEWYWEMFYPDRAGKVTISGRPQTSTHAWVLLQRREDGMYVGVNSHGTSWGDRGFFLISHTDLVKLSHRSFAGYLITAAE